MRSPLTLVLGILLGACGPGLAWEIYVAPDGDDAAAGTRGAPVRTIGEAQARLRSSGVAGHRTARLYLRGGSYPLSAPVRFGPEDSGTAHAPVIVLPWGSERPVLTGGRRLRLNWVPAGGGIQEAEVPPGLEIDQLFVNGERQPLARYPNRDPRAEYLEGFAADCISPARVARWADPAGGFLHAMHVHLWGDFHYRILGKDATNGLSLEGGWQNNRRLGMHPQYRFVENIREELDAPGEWFLDRSRHRLLFLPPEGLDLASALVETAEVRHLIEFQGSPGAPVRWIEVRGLTLAHTARTFMENREPLLRSDWTTYRGGAVVFAGAEHCALLDSRIDEVGGNGVFISGYNRDLTIANNEIRNPGASGVSLVGDPAAVRSPLFEYAETQPLERIDTGRGPRSDAYPARCRIEGNLIHGGGRVEKQSAGVNIAIASEITLSHNTIYDLPRAGINLCDGCFGGHVIEWNDVFDTVKETGDHGSFNSWGRDRFYNPDARVTEAWIGKHPDMALWDTVRPVTLRFNRWRCDHGWDIDLDDGSSNYDIHDNLCLAGGIKLREGFFRRVQNNILVDYTFCPHVWYPACSTVFERNILWRDGYAPAGMDFAAS
ncbi:MAG TPA: peptide-binding protein, partial [Verrucomicrobiales bacterium]|nr:peptide-binding protein [Verrucomicrobiales bacterium]